MGMGFDPKCAELARYMLDGDECVSFTEANVASLANYIQDSIESWIDSNADLDTRRDNGDLNPSAVRKLVVHCKRERFDVYIGRPSKWGNPFVVGKDGSREEVIQKYKEWLLNNRQLLESLPELKNKTLGCWCAPKACHGHVLADLANASGDGKPMTLESNISQS